MARRTELRIRADWGLVKFGYLPALAVGIAVTKYLAPAMALSLRLHPCGICMLLSRWGHHVEEWCNCKPLFHMTERGLVHEDGGEAVEYGWGDIVAVVMHRRNSIPPWRTNGSTEITPPFWLAITVRQGRPAESQDHGYFNRSRYLGSNSASAAEDDELCTICVWPRQVEGGLFSLMRFARELQRRLIEAAERGEIERLLPSARRALAGSAL